MVRCRPLAGGAAAARVHRCSKASTRPLLARCSRAPSRPRALLQFLQVDVPTSTTVDRSNIPGHRNPWPGRLPCVGPRVASRSAATAEGAQGQGPRTPILGAPHRDCSRQRLRPDPERFGHLLSRASASSLSGATRGEGDAAVVARACTARVAGGSCDAGFPRRKPAFTNPRGLPSAGRSLSRAGATLFAAGAARGRRQRLFHRRGACARDARTGPVGSVSRQGRALVCPVADPTAAPPTTSTFE